jgi:hypothetical protein
MFTMYYILEIRDGICIDERIMTSKIMAIGMIEGCLRARYGDSINNFIRSVAVDTYFSSKYLFKYEDVIIILVERIEDSTILMHSYIGQRIECI